MNDKDQPTTGPHGGTAAMSNTSPAGTDTNGTTRPRRHRRPARTGRTPENGAPVEATTDAKLDTQDAANTAEAHAESNMNAGTPTETNRTTTRRRSSRSRSKAPAAEETTATEMAPAAEGPAMPPHVQTETAAPEKPNPLPEPEAEAAQPTLTAPEPPAGIQPPQATAAPATEASTAASAEPAATQPPADAQPKYRYRFDRRTVPTTFPTSSVAAPAASARDLRRRGPMASQWARPITPPAPAVEREAEPEAEVEPQPQPAPSIQPPPAQPEPEEIVLPRVPRPEPPLRRYAPRTEPEVVVVETLAEDDETPVAEDPLPASADVDEETSQGGERRGGRNRRRRSSRNGGAAHEHEEARSAQPAPSSVSSVATQAQALSGGATAARYPQAQPYSAPEGAVSPYGSPEPAHAKGFGPTPRGIATEYRGPTNYGHARLSRAASEGAPISANQLASIVMEAIQQQTDRLLAEQRRHGPASTFTIAMPSTERVGIFVDVANLLYSSRSMRLPIDFGRLLSFLKGDRRLVRAHAYAPTSPEPYADQQFLQAVKGLGYRITTKDYKTFSSGAKKADLDLDLCMDIVRIVDAKAVDTIVLVSGDSDFLPLLDYCSDHGVRVEVAAFDESTAAILRQSCDLFLNLSVVEEIRADR